MLLVPQKTSFFCEKNEGFSMEVTQFSQALSNCQICKQITTPPSVKIWEFYVYVTTYHRDLNFDSHKRFCTRDFAYQTYILDYGESKKRCLSSCRNRSSCKNFKIFVKFVLILWYVLYQMVESYSLKAPNFLSKLYTFIL